ncbi:MAG: fused MFS/spermidine synthase [Gemmatimonadota bacterium]|nr:MAG: fused MFS/spermidine synthase [Gemmatimonadota bacterium]
MSPPRNSSPIFPLIVFLFFGSGATALIYEVAWLRSLILIFGSTAFAVSSVLTTFMAGLAVGSYVIGRWIDRRADPVAVYGALEIAIGLYALAVPQLFDVLQPVYRWLWIALDPPAYVVALFRFALCFAALFLPTAMMGGTLPALARFTALARQNLTAGVGGLYGVNTVGAFLGTLLAGFLLLPGHGLAATVRFAAAVNLLLGAAALGLAWWRHERAPLTVEEVGGSTVGASAEAAASAGALGAGAPLAITIAFALTGFAALALEVAWTRVLALVIGPSVYAFGLMLAAFLAGLGLGSLVFSWALGRYRWTGMAPFLSLSAAAGVLAFVTLLAFRRLPWLYWQLFGGWGAAESRPGLIFAVGLLLSGLVMLPPTLAMGGLFPAALEGFGISRGRAGGGVGRLYAANGGGAIAGSLAAGFLLIPWVGLQRTVLLAAWLYLAVAAALWWFAARGRRTALLGPALAAGLALVMYLAAPSWNRMLMSSGAYHYGIQTERQFPLAEAGGEGAGLGYEEVFYREGLVSTVLVARELGVRDWLGADSVPSMILVTNGKVDASSLADMPTQILSAHIPLLLHREPRSALVIGLASGTTAGSALRHEIRSLDVVEIEPAVVEASHAFDFVNGRPLVDRRTRLSLADGRTFLLLGEERFDVIISEPSNPWVSGSSNLFTLEFFQIARERLAEGGIFAGWIQMYGLAPENLEVVLRTFRTVFPETFVFNTIPYSDLLLIGMVEPARIDVEELERRAGRRAIREDLRRVGVEGAAQLLARGRLGPAELAEMAGAAPGPAPLNTDDNAWIEFRAPLDLYQRTRGANQRLIDAFARGLAPYLEADDPVALSAFRARLADEYQKLGFFAEAKFAR